MQVRSLGLEDPLEEENGNPLQYSCLENPMERGACRAIVHGVAEFDTTEATEHSTHSTGSVHVTSRHITSCHVTSRHATGRPRGKKRCLSSVFKRRVTVGLGLEERTFQEYETKCVETRKTFKNICYGV